MFCTSWFVSWYDDSLCSIVLYVLVMDTQYVTSSVQTLELNTSSYPTSWWVFKGRTWQNKPLSRHICYLIAAPYLYDLNSSKERRVCRSLCSLFWACSLFCWEILFQEANGIWHRKPIFSSSHLAVGSVGSTTANDNTSLLDKLFLIFNISTRLKHLSIFFFLFKKELRSNQEVAISRCLPVSPFSV